MLTIVAVVHVGLAAVWLGSMLYSLLVVQPRVVRFLAADDDRLEEFLTILGAGNRRPVLAIVAGLFVSGALLVPSDGLTPARTSLYVTEAMLLVAAVVVFWRVSWRLWPRRVFALPAERASHRAALRRHAVAMVTLVAAAFIVTVAALATT